MTRRAAWPGINRATLAVLIRHLLGGPNARPAFAISAAPMALGGTNARAALSFAVPRATRGDAIAARSISVLLGATRESNVPGGTNARAVLGISALLRTAFGGRR